MEKALELMVSLIRVISNIIILFKNQVLYGFRTKVALFENRPCTIGTTCRGQPEDLRKDQSQIPKNQIQFDQITPVLDQFIKDQTPEEMSTSEENQTSSKDSDSVPILLDRQSGEEFKSDSPPDCRVIQTQCPSSN